MKLYGSFEKVEPQDDGTLMVSGIASSEATDADGEVVKASAIEAALPDYMKFGAVREMHGHSAAGTAIEAKVSADGMTSFTAHVVDPVAVKKVQTGVYKGFSIGGRVTKRDADNQKMITGIRLTEISLVDRPANPDSIFSLYKAEGIEAPEAQADGAPAETTEKVEDASVVADTVASETVEKSLYDISPMTDIVSQLASMSIGAEYESQWEGDKSGVPAKLRALVAQAAEVLKEMTVEEADEAVARANDAAADGDGDVIVLAEATADLEKAGKRNSAADQDKVQAVHDHACALGAACDTSSTAKADVATGDDVLGKVAGLTADLAKMTTERDVLKKRVTAFEAEPAAPKGALKVIEKGDDVSKTVAEKDEDPTDPLVAMRKVHRSGGTLIKL